MANSKIEWTDYSWNFITGCNKVSTGCKNCYAETIANRFWKDRKFTDVRIDESKIYDPLRMRKPKKIFVNSMSDLLHEEVPFEIIDKAIGVMIQTKHVYQILTKRPQQMLRYCERINTIPDRAEKIFGNNIWLGVSVENQATADERIPLLMQTPAAIRWISVEPMLEIIHLYHLLRGKVHRQRNDEIFVHYLNWIVIGCESGVNRRECKIEWIEELVEDCKSFRIPVFVKQIQIDGKVEKDINKFPKHLQIRQFPCPKM